MPFVGFSEIRNLSRSKLLFGALFIIIGALLIMGVRFAIGIKQISDATISAQNLTSSLEHILRSEADLPYSELDELRAIRGTLNQARANLFPAMDLIPTLGWIPHYGDQLSLRKRDFELEIELTDAGIELLSGIRALATNSWIGPPSSGSPSLYTDTAVSMQIATSHFVAATEHFSSALTNLDQEDRTETALQIRLRRAIVKANEIALSAVVISENWKELFGYTDTARYLIVAVNADELRAGGGFIPALWDVEISRGTIQVADFIDAYDVERIIGAVPQAPIEMIRSMWAGGIFVRDAAWNPDFRDTSELLLKILDLQGWDSEYDGVIAIDQWGLQGILSAIGPVSINKSDQIDSDNFLQVLEQGTDGPQGRAYLSQIMDGIIDDINSISLGQSPVQFALLEALTLRHAQVYFRSDDIQSSLNNISFLAPITSHPPDTDYILVTDSNVGFSKANRHVSRAINYSVDLRDISRPTSQIELVYENRGRGESNGQCDIQDSHKAGQTYSDAKVACLWNLLRIYVPSGSILKSLQPLAMPEGALYRTIGYNDIEDSSFQYEDNGNAVWSWLFTLDVGEKRTLRFSYQNPDIVIEDDKGTLHYEGWIPRQPGLSSFNVTATFSLPSGYVIESSSHVPTFMEGEFVEYRFENEGDLRIKFSAALQGKEIDLSKVPLPGGHDATIGQTVLAEAVADVQIRTMPSSIGVANAAILPSVANRKPGEIVEYTVLAWDSRGGPISDFNVVWNVGTSSASSISKLGILTVGLNVGFHRNEIVATISTDPVTNEADVKMEISASIVIEHSNNDLFTHIVVYPPILETTIGGEIPLNAYGWDKQGRLIPLSQIRWSLNSVSAGTLTTRGTFIGGELVGDFPDALTVTGTQIKKGVLTTLAQKIDVKVIPPPEMSISTVELFPRQIRLSPGEQYRFRPIGLSASGGLLRRDWTWAISDTNAGSIDSQGNFTAADGAAGKIVTVVASTEDSRSGQIRRLSASSTVRIEDFRQYSDPKTLILKDLIELNIGSSYDLASLLADKDLSSDPANIVWSMLDSSAGNISLSGMFTAGNAAGLYPGAISLALFPNSDGSPQFPLTILMIDVQLISISTIESISSIIINGMPRSMTPGEFAKLSTTVLDDSGNPLSGLTILWDIVRQEAGRITKDGIFIAGPNTGTFLGAVRAQAVAP